MKYLFNWELIVIFDGSLGVYMEMILKNVLKAIQQS